MKIFSSISMYATCINASLSYIMVILLNDTSYVKNLSTALLMLLYTFLSSLYGLPCLGLRLLFGSPLYFALTPLHLKYALTS